MKNLYKLIILYMLKNSAEPLSDDFLFGFFFDNEYADFFTFKKALYELSDDGMIGENHTMHRTLYSITGVGIKTLVAYQDEMISPEIKNEIQLYIKENEADIKETSSVAAYCEKTADKKWRARLMILRKDKISAEFSFICDTQKDAANACLKWEKCADGICAELIDKLLNQKSN